MSHFFLFAVPIFSTEFNKIDEYKHLSEKIDVYKNSIDTITQYYQWSFGLVLSMLLVLIGANIYINKQKIERELKLRKEELEKLYDQDKQTTNSKIIALVKNLEDQISQVKKEAQLEIHYIQFENENIIGNKLSQALRILILLSNLYSNSQNYDWRFQQYLIYIIDQLEAGHKFDILEADEVNKMLEILPTTFNKEKERIVKADLYMK